MNEIDPKIKRMLDDMKDVPTRDAQAAARGRARFIAQIATVQPISKSGHRRLIGWDNLSRRKRFVMNALIAFIVAAVLLMGGGGTVYAAQDDLPGEPLYGVKTFAEDVRLFFNADPQSEIGMLMEMAQTRVEEMVAMTMKGELPPDKVNLRLEQHINQALRIAAGMNEAAMLDEMERIRARVQSQTAIITILQNQTHGDSTLFLERTRTMLESRLRLVEDGIADPQGFRNAVQQEAEHRAGQTKAPDINGPNASETPTPGENQNGNGPADDTPQGLGEGNGQGGPNPSVVPGAGDGQGSTPSVTPEGGGGQGPNATPGGQGSPGGNKP